MKRIEEMKKKREKRNKLIFGACTIVSGVAAILGINALPVMAAEDIGEEMVVDENMGAGDNVASELSEDSQIGVMAENEDLGVYDFKDNKTTGTITVTKEWSDKRTNSERPEPEIKISTKKPGKNHLGYTVTFHGNKDAGLVFDDGSDVNEVVYNSSGQIVDGAFKMPAGFSTDTVSWFTDEALTNKVDVSENGVIQMALSGDIDLYGKVKTFEVESYFYTLIPERVTEIIFTDEVKPENASVIDVDADRDGGVIAWTENSDTIMKVSTQIKGMKVQAAKNSNSMFSNRAKLTNINFSMFDTAKVTNMSYMFRNCSGLTSLDLTSFNTANVGNTTSMFEGCSGLTSLDLTPLDTTNVTSMSSIFSGCSGLTSLDLTPLDTANVTYIRYMFSGCSGLTSLDLTPLDTQNVTTMSSMFSGCSSLTSLDLTPLNTTKVTDMSSMFSGCSGLTSLDLTPLDTQNVTTMRQMFTNCYKLSDLNLTQLNTQMVTDMQYMFCGCMDLTSLSLTSFNTQNVTNMNHMFSQCTSLTTLDLASFDTQNVTDMSGMFTECKMLTTLNLTSLNTQNMTNMSYIFFGCENLTSLDLTLLNTQNVINMQSMFAGCSGLTTLKTGAAFKFVGTNYYLSGTWRNTAGETFTSGTFPSNVADTYTKISN